MGNVFENYTQCCTGVDDSGKKAIYEPLRDNDKTIKKESKSNDIIKKTSYYIAFNEALTKNSTFHYTIVSTKLNESTKESSIEMKSNGNDNELLNAGERVTDVTNVNKNGEIYLLIRKRVKNDDYNELQRYKINNYPNIFIDGNIKDISFKYIDKIERFLDETRTNIEGIEVVYGNDMENVGFIMVNDYFNASDHSQIYFMNIQNKIVKKIFSFGDEGKMQLSCINYFNGFDYDGYIFLPQTCHLDGNAFENWLTNNEGEAKVYFMKRKDILSKIQNMDETKDDNVINDIEMNLDSIECTLKGFDSDKNLFKQYNKSKGYTLKGFEALAFDHNFNGLLTFEVMDTNVGKESTFNFIIHCKFILNDQQKLTLRINVSDYKIIRNNGGSHSRSQESLLHVLSQ